MARLLEARALRVAYDAVQAVREVDFHIDQGELVCLIGANGAGKSSLLKALTGLVPARAGQIFLRGEDITRLPSHAIVARGIALVPEGRGVFSRMSVAENLAMGAYARHDKLAMQTDLKRVLDLFPRLHERRAQAAGTLSGGEQQMLAIGRAMMSRPQLLLLDEPSMGLAPLMVQKIFETITQIAAGGVTILLVEQNAKLALEVSDRGYVMESGSIALTDSSAALAENPEVRACYLGES